MLNQHGLDTDYFIRLCAREFNPDVIRSQRPEDIARAFARAARTACAEVLQEREFQTTTAAYDVLAERLRQISAEDFDASHDDMATRGQIAMAAGLYALDAAGLAAGRTSLSHPSSLWPWPEEWWKPAGARRNLVKAGALILAEIERLDRAAEADSP